MRWQLPGYVPLLVTTLVHSTGGGGGRKDISENSIIVGRGTRGLGRSRAGSFRSRRTSRLMNLRRGALPWTTEGINNAVKYFMDFVECGWCVAGGYGTVRTVRSRRTHLSRSGQLQSLMGTNGRPPGCELRGDVT